MTKDSFTRRSRLDDVWLANLVKVMSCSRILQVPHKVAGPGQVRGNCAANQGMITFVLFDGREGYTSGGPIYA